MADNTDTTNLVTAAAAVELKKTKKVSPLKKTKIAPTHPPTSQMVDAAIKSLKERTGSSLLAIKKYLAANYKVDADKLAPFIKKYLKSSVVSGKLVQTKGKGASGSFKLSAAATKSKKEIKPKAKVEKKKISDKKPKKAVAKKTAAASEKKKKVAAIKKTSVEKKKVAKTVKKTIAVKTKTPKQKSTKPSKIDAKKLKVPAPKKTTSPKKAVGKKTTKK